MNKRKIYWLCKSEKRIYHSRPSFSTKSEQDKMYALGITKQETWKKIGSETAKKLATYFREHPFYRGYSTAEYQIIDCPELLEFQIKADLEGHYLKDLIRRLKQPQSNAIIDESDNEDNEITDLRDIDSIDFDL